MLLMLLYMQALLLATILVCWALLQGQAGVAAAEGAAEADAPRLGALNSGGGRPSEESGGGGGVQVLAECPARDARADSLAQAARTLLKGENMKKKKMGENEKDQGIKKMRARAR